MPADQPFAGDTSSIKFEIDLLYDPGDPVLSETKSCPSPRLRENSPHQIKETKTEQAETSENGELVDKDREKGNFLDGLGLSSLFEPANKKGNPLTLWLNNSYHNQITN